MFTKLWASWAQNESVSCSSPMCSFSQATTCSLKCKFLLSIIGTFVGGAVLQKNANIAANFTW